MQHKRSICRIFLYPAACDRDRVTAVTLRRQGAKGSLFFSFLLLISPVCQTVSWCQTSTTQNIAQEKTSRLSEILRLERVPVVGGSELITVHARLDGLQSQSDGWVPMVSILRDTLGDMSSENDHLRYVWPLTYTRPTVKQRLAAAIPFLYTRVGNKRNLSQGLPPPAFDLAAPESEVWEKIFWTAFQNILLDPYGTPVKASTSSYRRDSSSTFSHRQNFRRFGR